MKSRELDYSDYVEIAEGVFWVGFADETAGIHCNPYLIVDNNEAVLIDSGSRNDFSTVMLKIMRTGTNPGNIKRLIYQHYDPDLCGNIPQSIIGMLGGEIWVESEAGKGSKFAFTFKAQIKPEETGTSFAGRTVLLAEDVEVNREIIMAMLEDTLNIVCAENGCEAVELFTSEPGKYDVIFMDINMPKMDGVEAARRIRAHGPEGARIPIFAMTANVHPDEVKTYLEAGMTDHIGKPIDFDRLLHLVGLHVR